MSELGRISRETLAADIRRTLCPRGRNGNLSTGPSDSALDSAQGMLNLIAGLVIAFLGWLLGRAIGYVIGFRGGRSLLEQSGRTQKFRLKTIDKDEKQFERFTWLGVLAALCLLSCQVGEEVTQGCCKVGNTKKLS